jgi:hypothetical protein
MKRAAFLSLCLGDLTLTQVGHANITTVVWNGSDGALNNPVYWNVGPSGDITGGGFYAGQSGGGNTALTIGTDTPLDPAFTLTTDVINSSGFTWTSYHVDVSMGTSFTFSGIVNNIPGDWTHTSSDGTVPVAGVFTGHIVFTSGTPIAVGGEFNFGYTVNFSGGPNISFSENLTPVPEPGTLSLLAVGGALLMIIRRRR